MKKPLLLTLAMLAGTFAANAATHGAEPLNYQFTLLIVAVIAVYSAKLVADKQKQTKKKAGN